jgi:hypothetical protein
MPEVKATEQTATNPALREKNDLSRIHLVIAAAVGNVEQNPGWALRSNSCAEILSHISVIVRLGSGRRPPDGKQKFLSKEDPQSP